MDKPNFRDYPNTAEGLAAYDAANAAYEREQNPLIGKEFVDTVEDVAGQASQLPVIKQGLQLIGGAARWVDETMTQDQGIGGQLYRSYQTLKDTSEQQFGNLAEDLGVDPRIGRFAGGEVIDLLATAGTGSIAKKAASLVDSLPPGSGMTPQLVTASGSLRFPTQQAVKGGPVSEIITATDPEVLGTVGAKTGDTLIDTAQSKRLIRRGKLIEKSESSIQTLNDQIGTLMELKGDPKNLAKYLDDNPELKDLFARYKGRKDQFDKALNRLREQRKGAQESLSRQQSNVLPEDADNPFFFRTTKGMAAKRAQEIKENVTGYLEQHHLFPKGASAAFFGKMDELISKGIGDADDLVLMAQYAKKRGMEAGDYKANMLNMRTKPHNEMHTVLRELGEEPSKSFLQNQLKDVKSVDDLLVKWKEFLDDTASYNIQTAKTWEPLDNLLKELQGK